MIGTADLVDTNCQFRPVCRWTVSAAGGLPITDHPKDASPVSKLVAIIDAYKDTHGGPSDSSVARAIGVKPQTLSSWRTRGLKEPPDRDALRKLATLANLDYESVVLRAVLIDVGWIEGGGGDDAFSAAPMNDEDQLSARRGKVANSDLADLPSVAKKRKPRTGE